MYNSYLNTKEHVWAILIIVLAISVCLFPTLLGKIPCPASNLLSLSPWEPESFDIHQDFHPSLEVTRYLPWRVFMHHCANTGESLLWNPYENCGMPFLALWRTRCFSPFSLPFYLLPLPLAFSVCAWLKLLTAGVLAYIVGRLQKLSVYTSSYLAVAFICGAAVLPQLGLPFSDSSVWFPIMIIVGEKLSGHPPKGLLLLVFCFVMMLLGGAPEVAITSFIFLLCYQGLRIFWNSNTSFAIYYFLIPAIIGTLLLVLGIAAIQILPFLEYVRESDLFSFSQKLHHVQISDYIVLILPHFFGRSSLFDPGNYQAVHLLFLGRVQLFFLIFWVAANKYFRLHQKIQTRILMVLSVFFNLLAILIPKWTSHLSWGFIFSPNNLLFVNTFIIPLLVSHTMEEWVEFDAEACLKTLKRFLVLLFLASALFLYFLFVRFNEARPNAPDIVHQCISLLCYSAIILGLLAFTIFRPSLAILCVGLTLATFVDLTYVFGKQVKFSSPQHLFPETQFIACLKEKNSRVCGDFTLKSWPLLGNFIPQVYSTSNFELKRNNKFMTLAQKNPLLMRRLGAPNLLLTRKDIQGPFSKIRPLLAVKHVFPSGAILFEDLDANPRVWMAYEATQVDETHSEIIQPDDPIQVEGVIPVSLVGNGPKAVPVIKTETHSKIVLEVGETKPGILVMADSYYPGWKVYDNGKLVPTLVVDHFMRGVALEAGKHELIFSYQPLSFRLGAIISLFSSTIYLLWILNYARNVKQLRS